MKEYLGIKLRNDRPDYINEFSETLLNDFYVKDGETITERLATPASAFSYGDYELANRIYEYVHKGWLVYSSPVNSNAPAIKWPSKMEVGSKEAKEWLKENIPSSHKGMPISCFAAGTPVFTPNGTANIETIKDGDLVLTHKGRFKPVVATRKSKSSDIYRFKATGKSTELVVTGNHLLYTNKGWKRVDEIDRKLDLIATSHFAERYDSDVIFYPKNKESQSNNIGEFSRSLINEQVDLTMDLAWALGFWFAEGSTSDNGMVRVTNQDLSLIERWCSIIKDSFGAAAKIDDPEGRNWINGQVCSKNLQEFFDDEFGKGCYEKKMPSHMMKMNSPLFTQFLDGFYAGDGFKTTKKKAFEIANPVLVSQFSLLMMRDGVKHNLQLRKKTQRDDSFNGIITWHNKVDKIGVRNGIEMPDGLCYRTIESIEPINAGEIDVYDIQVLDDESFSAAGVIAHNCFLSYVGDTIDDQIDSDSELAYMSIIGGGVGKHLQMRGVTKKSPGAIPYVKKDDGAIQYYKQGETRKGSVAHYLDISHPDIQEFINIRVPTGGDINRKAFNVHNAININYAFLDAVKRGEDWNLVNPHNNEVTDTIPARELWQAILEARYRTGEPYINNVEEANDHLPQSQKDLGLSIHGSNLCNEIHLPTNEDRSAVCCLSSVNLALFDEWQDDPLFIEDCVTFLDNVLQFFIDVAPKGMEKAVYSAKQERAIGLGMLGWHTLLQRKSIPWETGGFGSAIQLANQTAKHIKEKAVEASLKLGTERGESPDMVGTGRRNSHLLAVAPNANSGIIAGVSASIEPIRANCYTHRTRAGSFLVVNKDLESLLRSINDDDEWISEQIQKVMDDNGSVANLDCLNDHQKAVFKTAPELDQLWVVEHSRIRQSYTCQGQSVNLFFPAGCSKSYFNKVHLAAFDQNGSGSPLKGLYYCRTEAKQKADKVSVKVERQALADYETQSTSEDTCLSCQG